MLFIKTTQEKFAAVRDAIRHLHSYDVPECISLVIEDGSAAYVDGIAQSLK